MLGIALCTACFFRAKINKKVWPPYFEYSGACTVGYSFICQGIATRRQRSDLIGLSDLYHPCTRKGVGRKISRRGGNGKEDRKIAKNSTIKPLPWGGGNGKKTKNSKKILENSKYKTEKYRPPCQRPFVHVPGQF